MYWSIRQLDNSYKLNKKGKKWSGTMTSDEHKERDGTNLKCLECNNPITTTNVGGCCGKVCAFKMVTKDYKTNTMNGLASCATCHGTYEQITPTMYCSKTCREIDRLGKLMDKMMKRYEEYKEERYRVMKDNGVNIIEREVDENGVLVSNNNDNEERGYSGDKIPGSTDEGV